MSHELRLSNAQPQRLEYVLGANFWREQTDETDMGWGTFVNASPTNPQSFENISAGVPLNCTVPAPNTVAGCTSPNPNIVGLNQHQAKGAFGQLNFHVTDALKLTAGLRYSSDSMFRHASIAAGPSPNNLYWADVKGNPCHPGDPCVPLSNGQSGSVVQNDVGTQSASKATWRVGADYQLVNNQMVYGYVATGYKAGSFNDICPGTSPPGPCSYGPESMTAYEIGYKGKIRPNLEIDSSVYYYDYSKYQLTGAKFLAPNLTGGPPLVLIYTTLVPLALSGWEGELHWNITRNDLLNVTAAIESGYYKGGPGHATAGFGYLVTADWSNKRLDALPTWAGTLSYEHRFALSNGGYVSARVNSKFSAGYYESDLGGQYNGPPFGGPPGGPPPFNFTTFSLFPTQYVQGSFTRTDLDLGYTSESGKYSVDAFVRNIEDKMQMTGSPQNLYAPGQGVPDQVTIAVSAPRTMGVRFGVKF
jgi:iron complex outermembrane receptor protein